MTHHFAQHLQMNSGPPDLDGMSDRLQAIFPIALAIGIALLLLLWLFSLHMSTRDSREISAEVQRLKALSGGGLSDQEVQWRALDNVWHAKTSKGGKP